MDKKGQNQSDEAENDGKRQKNPVGKILSKNDNPVDKKIPGAARTAQCEKDKKRSKNNRDASKNRPAEFADQSERKAKAALQKIFDALQPSLKRIVRLRPHRNFKKFSRICANHGKDYTLFHLSF